MKRKVKCSKCGKSFMWDKNDIFNCDVGSYQQTNINGKKKEIYLCGECAARSNKSYNEMFRSTFSLYGKKLKIDAKMNSITKAVAKDIKERSSSHEKSRKNKKHVKRRTH